MDRELADREKTSVHKWCGVRLAKSYQGSILGPMLFVIFINDIDSTVVSSLLKFADDTKTLRQVPEVEYAFTLQEDLHSMHEWNRHWQLLFNFTLYTTTRTMTILWEMNV